MPKHFQDMPGLTLGAGNQIHASVMFELPVRLYSYAMIRRDCRIGRYSYVNTHTTLESGTRVGRFCSISRNVNIGAWAHPLDRLSTSPVSYNADSHFKDHDTPIRQVPFDRPEHTFIGNDVWIGANAVIRRGVTVGDGAVIGAGAFVTGDVAPYDIVGGIPARVLRSRFAPGIVAELMALKWWDLEMSDLASVPFDSIDDALHRLRQIRGHSGGQADTEAAGAELDPSDGPVSGIPLDQPGRIAALQALVDAVPAAPRRPADADHQAFARFLREKLYDADAPAPLIDAVLDEAARIEIRYAADNPLDAAVLNTKLQHLIDLVTLPADSQAPLYAGLKRTVHEVLRSAH